MFRFPWGDMHSLNLGWFLQKFNELREDWATAEAGIDGALDAEIQKAEDALSDVFDARDAAAASATAAAGSASSAGTSATAAQNSATAAASSATLANNKATAAGLSEAAAAQSATQAGNSATAAATSATQASQSATNAAGSATAAGQQATNAAGSATAASNSATAAAGSASAAAASAAAAEAVEESIPEDYTTLSNEVAQIKNGTQVINPTIYAGSYVNLDSGYNHHRIVIDNTETADVTTASLVFYPALNTQKIIRIGNLQYSRGVKTCYEIDKVGNKWIIHACAHYTDYSSSLTVEQIKVFDITITADDIYRIGTNNTDLTNATITYYVY